MNAAASASADIPVPVNVLPVGVHGGLEEEEPATGGVDHEVCDVVAAYDGKRLAAAATAAADETVSGEPLAMAR